MSVDPLVENLERTREGYDAELRFHRFLFDSYTGGGGYQGKMQRSKGSLQRDIATAYGQYFTGAGDDDTYLDQFPREDVDKFAHRKASAHYDNYVAPLTDLKISFLLRKEFQVRDRPAAVEEWHKNIDGRGTCFDEVLHGLVLRMALFGYVPAAVDLPRLTEPARTRADEIAQGIAPRLVPLTPSHLLDYEVDEGGDLEWAKLRCTETERNGWDGAPEKVDEYTIWTRTDFSVYEVRKDQGGKKTATLVRQSAHSFGCVPLAIGRHKPAVLDPVLGIPMHAEVSTANRALFNRVSELEESLRQHAFPLLILVQGEADTQDGEVEVGSENALSLDPKASKGHYYLETTGQSMAAIETRIANTIREIYRMARVEFTRPTGGVQSGAARSYDFQQTNRALADFARQIAHFIMWIDDLVGRALGVSDADREKETISAPDSFDVEELSEIIASTLDGMKLDLGPTATKLLKQRAAFNLLPDLSTEDRDAIESDLDEELKTESAADAMDAEIAAAGTPPGQPPAPNPIATANPTPPEGKVVGDPAPLGA